MNRSRVAIREIWTARTGRGARVGMGHELRNVVGSETFLIDAFQVPSSTIDGTWIATAGMGSGVVGPVADRLRDIEAGADASRDSPTGAAASGVVWGTSTAIGR